MGYNWDGGGAWEGGARGAETVVGEKMETQAANRTELHRGGAGQGKKKESKKHVSYHTLLVNGGGVFFLLKTRAPSSCFFLWKAVLYI